MKQSPIGVNDISLSISSLYLISFTWSANYVNDTIVQISLVIQSILQGNEKLNIQLSNYKVFRGYNGGWLSNSNLTAALKSNNQASISSANFLSIIMQYSWYFGLAITFILALIGGGSLEMIWALLNTLQLISYLPLMITFFPQHVRIMFKVLKFTNTVKPFVQSHLNDRHPFDFGRGTGQRVLAF